MAEKLNDIWEASMGKKFREIDEKENGERWRWRMRALSGLAV
jgi:hypothetical protein